MRLQGQDEENEVPRKAETKKAMKLPHAPASASTGTTQTPLWESDIWVRGLVESAVDAVVVIGEEGEVIYLNPAAQRMFGYVSEEVIGNNISMLMPQPHRDRHDDYIKKYLSTGQRKVIGIGREVMGRRRSGEQFPLHLSVSEVRVHGQRIFTGIIRNISDEKRASLEQQRLLAELQLRNKTITCLYSVSEVIRASETESDLFNGVARLIRPACYRPEITRARLTFDGQPYMETACDTTPWLFGADIVVGGRKRGRIELIYLSAFDASERSSFLHQDQHLIEAIAHTLGETIERREAEAQVIQASKLASIGELAAGVGHEINNPINGIINCADILLDSLEAGCKDHQFAELVRSEADRIAAIVKSLLAFSRQDREQHSLARLSDIVQSVLSLSGKRIEKSHIILILDVPETLPKVKCRSEQMQQVLMNLIINAIHTLDERYPAAHEDKRLNIVAKTVTLRDRPFLRLTVEDFGAGVAPENMERIFDPFFTTKGRDRGTGLGLSVSDGIVKDHGGLISVESEVLGFTRFHVDLPLDNEWELEHELVSGD